MNNQQPLHSPTCAELMTMAERELAAFISAVAELYGAELAGLSAEIWLNALELMSRLPGPTDHDWRAITVAAMAHLPNQMTNTKVSAIPSSNCFDLRGSDLMHSAHRKRVALSN